MLYLFILVPIIIACGLLFIPHRLVRWLALGIYLVMLAFSIYLFIRARFYNEIFIVTTGGEGILGITLFCDLTASIFLVLICLMFLFFFFYSAIRDKALYKFNFFISILQSLIILIVLSRDLFNIFIAVEVATIVCGILIMYKKESRSIYDGLVYLLTNNAGMLLFLLGVGIMYRQFGVLDMAVITSMMEGVSAREVILPYALIMTGVALKCAMVPVHMWLPYAHGTPGAPTVVSAILSGLYVKSGIYLFIRMRAMFLPAINMDSFFLVIGIITALLGIVMAIREKDIKLILAYHTISQIGLIVFGLSLNNTFSYAGAMLHIINHALFKSLLFLASGILIKSYNTRNINDIRGVMRTYPIIGIAIIAGILGITGAPLFNGSISKYYLERGIDNIWVEVVFYVINFGTILSFVKYSQVLFKEKNASMPPNDKSSNAVLMILGALCLLTGVLGSPFLFLISGEHYPIDFIGYLNKVAIWAGSIILAWLIYYRVIKRIKIKAGRAISFNGIAICMILFVISILVTGYLLY